MAGEFIMHGMGEKVNLGEENWVEWKFNVRTDVRDNWAICTSDLRWELFSQLRNSVFNFAFRKRLLKAQQDELRLAKAWILKGHLVAAVFVVIGISCLAVVMSLRSRLENLKKRKWLQRNNPVPCCPTINNWSKPLMMKMKILSIPLLKNVRVLKHAEN